MEDDSYDNLKRLAKAQGFTIGDYCEFMIDYIEKNGIDPDKSINTLMQKNNKRLSQVIAVIKHHEDKALWRIAKSNEEMQAMLLRLIQIKSI